MIGMVGGIRSRSFTEPIGTKLPAYVILVTTHISADYANPWDDVIDDRAGTIWYWGDAKLSDRNTLCEDFKGNRCMKAIYDELLVGNRVFIPPILHFTRRSAGKLVFNGLCALEHADLTWFEDQGRPIRNYRFQLSILDEEHVSVEWLRQRMVAKTTDTFMDGAPRVWVDYVNGRTRRRQVWRAKIRSMEEQLPEGGTDDAAVLGQLSELPPEQFERVIVALFREIKAVEHTITQTRYVGDGGFDFFGTFTMPLPVSYEIPFRGEVKQYGPKNGVGAKDVSRLVARLGRGQYGIFVTTSYYSRQAQKEVIQDSYPVRLIAGIDLVQFLRELKLVTGDQIRPEWLSSVLS